MSGGIERFHFEYESSCFRHNQKTVSADNAAPRQIALGKGQGRGVSSLSIHDHSQARDRKSDDARAKYQNRSRLEKYRRHNPQSANRRSRLLRRNRASWADDQIKPRRAARLRRGRRNRKTRYRKPRFDNRKRPE